MWLLEQGGDKLLRLGGHRGALLLLQLRNKLLRLAEYGSLGRRLLLLLRCQLLLLPLRRQVLLMRGFRHHRLLLPLLPLLLGGGLVSGAGHHC